MKIDRAPGEDGITAEIPEIDGVVTIESTEVPLNKCLKESKIPETWNNAQVVLLCKKDDKLKIEIYTCKPIVVYSIHTER